MAKKKKVISKPIKKKTVKKNAVKKPKLKYPVDLVLNIKERKNFSNDEILDIFLELDDAFNDIGIGVKTDKIFSKIVYCGSGIKKLLDYQPSSQIPFKEPFARKSGIKYHIYRDPWHLFTSRSMVNGCYDALIFRYTVHAGKERVVQIEELDSLNNIIDDCITRLRILTGCSVNLASKIILSKKIITFEFVFVSLDKLVTRSGQKSFKSRFLETESYTDF